MDDLVGKVLVINLSSEPGRMQEAAERIEATGTKRYERLDAVDGRKLTDCQRRSLTTRYCQAMCTPSMIGCFLSHRAAWQKCVDEGLASVLVLEDDVMFTDDATQGMRVAFRELPQQWDMLFLGCFTCNENETTAEDASIVRMLYANRREEQVSEHLWMPTMIFGMHAYAVSQSGAAKLLALMQKASNHVDWELSRYLDRLVVLALRPGVAYQTGMDTSSMGSKAPVLMNKLLTHIRLGSHEQDGRTLAWLCSEGWFRLGHDKIVVNKYFVILLLASALGAWRLAAGSVFLDALLACLLLRFSKSASLVTGYCSLLVAVALGAALHTLVSHVNVRV